LVWQSLVAYWSPQFTSCDYRQLFLDGLRGIYGDTKAKERKRRSRAKNKSKEKTVLESAKRKERRDQRPPEKEDEDNANRRLDWTDKKEDANANRRQKYQSSNLRAVNEKRRLKYLQMTSEKKSVVREKGAERFRIHRAKMIGPSVECAEYGCKSLVPLLRDERYCYRHQASRMSAYQERLEWRTY